MMVPSSYHSYGSRYFKYALYDMGVIQAYMYVYRCVCIYIYTYMYRKGSLGGKHDFPFLLHGFV